MRMDKDICKVMFNEVELQGVCKRLGEQITKDYEGKDLLIVGILNGAIVFVTDLMRQIDRQINIDFMSVSSYGSGTKTSGVVKIVKDLDQPLEDKEVLVVEDIIDSGRTLSYLLRILKGRHPASIRLCTLLDKPDRRVRDVHVDYVGFNIPDEFVVGFGLDYAQKYRNLPFIGVVEPEAAEDAEEGAEQASGEEKGDNVE